MQFRYDFCISELLLRVESPREIRIPDNFQPFLAECPPTKSPDIILHFLFEPTSGASDEDIGKLSRDNTNLNFRISETFSLGNGEAVVRQDPSGRGSPCRIFVPESFADIFCGNGNWLMYMAIERMMMEFDRFFLHASAVVYQGKAYLFSAPSGGGKSTHAALWKEHFGAKLLNGDKVLIEVRDGQCIAHGSPVAGSSGIYAKGSAPIGGIYLLKKDKQNKITPVSPRSAMLSLYSEAIKCSHDPAFNSRLLDLIEKLRMQVPVLSLACLPEESAVECILQNNEGMTL
jgi:hypothetical protein